MTEQVTFKDLEIHITPSREGGYSVLLRLADPGGEWHGHVPATIGQFHQTFDPDKDGEELFANLFSHPVLREGWAEARGRAGSRRIRLHIDHGCRELEQLPWETLRDAYGSLALTAQTPFSRYLEACYPWGRPAAVIPIRLLVAIANPPGLKSYGLAPVDVLTEIQSIQAGLISLQNQIQVEFLDQNVTPLRLADRLRQGNFHILHFIGHGGVHRQSGQAALFLEDSFGGVGRMSEADLATLLKILPAPPGLVFLSACESAGVETQKALTGLAPQLVATGAPAVIAMRGKLSMAANHQLVRVFYEELARDGQIDRALNTARASLCVNPTMRTDAFRPVLYLRMPDARLWAPTPLPIAPALPMSVQAGSECGPGWRDARAINGSTGPSINTPTPKTPVRIDPEVMIIPFDLTALVDPLCQVLSSYRGGCCGFVLNGIYGSRARITEKYFLIRLRNEIRFRTPREITPYTIKLMPGDLGNPEDAIERHLLQQTQTSRLEEVFTLDKRDILIYAINHRIPEQAMSRCVSAFWKTVQAKTTSFTRGRNLILICINAARTDPTGQPLLPDEFIPLNLPNEIDPESLAIWVESYLQQQNLDDGTIEFCLSRLSVEKGHLDNTYLALQELVEDMTDGRYGG